MAIQYSAPLQALINARSSGARAPFDRGDLRGRLRACSAMVRVENAVDASAGDVVGFFELEPGIRLMSVNLKASPVVNTGVNIADFELIAYNPADPTNTNKHVVLVPQLTPHSNTAGNNTVGDTGGTIMPEVAAQLARQFPLEVGYDTGGTDVYWNPKLVQLKPSAYAWDLPGAYSPGTSGVVGERVLDGGVYYKCVESYNSTDSTFAADLAAGYWERVSDTYSYVNGDYVIDSNEVYRCNTDHVAVTSFATGYAAGYWTQEFGIIDISDACPVPDGVSGVNPGSFGVGIRGVSGTVDFAADAMLQLNLTYLHE